MNPLHRRLPSHRRSWRRALWPAYLEYLKRSTAPILVGPWRGEVGFEVMYWIPFLERIKQLGIAPERLIPISRGGASAWYGCPHGLELFAMRTPQQVRVENKLMVDRVGVQKQIFVSDWDRAVLKDAAETMKLKHYHVLHPAWMFHLLAPFWTAYQGSAWLAKRADYPTIAPPPLPSAVQLPEVFVAAKFYARETWPLGHKTTSSVTAAVLEKIADMTPVVVLDSPVVADEHLDFPLPKHANILRLTDLAHPNPETNLALQSSVLARAQGFVGTYGGVAQLALRMGKPSVSFYLEWGGTAITHRNLSDTLSVHNNVAFQVYRAAEIPLANFVLPVAEIAQAPGKKLDTRPHVAEVLTEAQ